LFAAAGPASGPVDWYDCILLIFLTFQDNYGHVHLTKRKIVVILLLLAAVGIFAAFNLRGKGPVQYYTAKVETGEIKQVVEATGTINAVITVQV